MTLTQSQNREGPRQGKMRSPLLASRTTRRGVATAAMAVAAIWLAAVAISSQRRPVFLDLDGDAGAVSGAGREGKVPFTFWRHKINAPSPFLGMGKYSTRDGDPWAAADGGSYALWADDALHKGEGVAGQEPLAMPLHRVAAEQAALKGEEPDEKNQKNGWEEYQFDKWLRKQGGEPSKFWKVAGYENKGEEYVLAFRRLGIRNFGDLAAFDEKDEDKGGDFPGFDCEDPDLEPGGERSGHYMCGQLPRLADEQPASDLWYVDHRGNITAAAIHTQTARAAATADRWKRLVTGNRPFDDGKFFCYSQYQEEPEYSACLRQLKDNIKPSTGGRKYKGRSWGSLTKGLWEDHGGLGSMEENEGMLGQSWGQLTSGLWGDKKPYKERNGMDQ